MSQSDDTVADVGDHPPSLAAAEFENKGKGDNSVLNGHPVSAVCNGNDSQAEERTGEGDGATSDISAEEGAQEIKNRLSSDDKSEAALQERLDTKSNESTESAESQEVKNIAKDTSELERKEAPSDAESQEVKNIAKDTSESERNEAPSDAESQEVKNIAKDTSESERNEAPSPAESQEVKNIAKDTSESERNEAPSAAESNTSDTKKDEYVPQLDADVKKEEESSKSQEEKQEEYMDILNNGELLKKVLKPGDGIATRPVDGDLVTIKVEGKLDNGQIVDKHDSLSFIVGDQDVVAALDMIVKLMETSQTIELITSARFAYGEKGREPDIPPNARITYTIELKEKELQDTGSMTVSKRLELAEKKRLKGNNCYSQGDFDTAIVFYSKTLQVLDPSNGTFSDDAEKLQMVLECRLKCFNNMAACQLKREYYEPAITSCKEVLQIQPDNPKALYRIGKALGAVGNFKEAIVYLKRAVKIEPETKIIHQELSRFTKKLEQETKSEKDMYRKMLGTTPTPVKAPEKSSTWKWTLLGGVGVAFVAAGIATAYRYFHH